ncbi:MAG: hypothetical protein JOY62_00230 [Acidobacteriaceae bacterium]|nr:hypothetical protein [Acidobacteriaceae bacterium]MBV9778370.1 hypothetical protein [Acidobacteriaceae bacterium]
MSLRPGIAKLSAGSLILIGSHLSLCNPDNSPTAAILDHIGCKASWRKDSNSPATPITETHDRGRRLHTGEEIRCDSSDGYMVVIPAIGEPQAISAKAGWFRVPSNPAAEQVQVGSTKSPAPTPSENEIGRALAYHARPAATREGSSRLIYPVTDSVVLPDRFIILWKPASDSGKIHLQISAANKTIWTADADVTLGKLDSPEARRALGASQEQSHTNPYSLILQWSTDQAGGRVPFTVISAAEEKNLAQELAFWDRQRNDLLRLIGRAYSFDKRKLYWEAAQESEAALKLAPESCPLLQAAAAAEENAGNMARVRELRAAIENLPGGCSGEDQ